jgi:hypothetical protein
VFGIRNPPIEWNAHAMGDKAPIERRRGRRSGWRSNRLDEESVERDDNYTLMRIRGGGMAPCRTGKSRRGTALLAARERTRG